MDFIWSWTEKRCTRYFSPLLFYMFAKPLCHFSLSLCPHFRIFHWISSFSLGGFTWKLRNEKSSDPIFFVEKKKDHWKIYFLGKVILSAVSLCSLIPETDLIFLSLRFFIFHRHSQNPIRLKRMAKYIAFINIWIEQIDIWRCSPIRIHPHYTKINLIWNHANHTRSKAI